MKRDRLLDHPSWAADWFPNVDDDRSIARFRKVIWVVLAAGLLTFVVRGADNPADPYLPSERMTVEDTAGP